ncbi:AraC-type DNA-binding protein [Flavobacterium anhuiense]|uniref:AraC-type DNA-binding protein n=1 Tax=Flavobacterium anhuiense TaxID=459526 RepID=A0ABY0LX27_9FLAO|nr:helix-turn-helix domain-containing protein [Flavobacterium anhuiense]SCY75340.1 AraC-type DNA-binding protein [Flavobacterium anhuiense]
MELLKSFGNKKIGYVPFDTTAAFDEIPIPCDDSADCYVILFAKKGSTVTADFSVYKAEHDKMFFFNIGQQFQLDDDTKGHLIYFNPEFYCIAFHDKELTCDGILFNNVFETPMIGLDNNESDLFCRIIKELKNELYKDDYWTEEMLRTKLKELIITASRSWLERSPDNGQAVIKEDEVSRKFSQLVEIKYNKLHSVSQYAELLYISPKTLNRKIVHEKGISPNIIIKNRIMLQAKRLLANTDLTVKEISAQLGYDDQSYFVRFFRIQTGKSPIEFRKQTNIEQ